MPTHVSSRKRHFIPPPAKKHLSVCVDILALGIIDRGRLGPRDTVEIRWQTQERMADGKPYLIIERYNPSLYPGPPQPAKLRVHLEGWRGRPFTESEALDFVLDVLVGKMCVLDIRHRPRLDGTQRGYVHAIEKAPPNAPILQPEYERRVLAVTSQRPSQDNKESDSANEEEEVPF